MSKQEPTIQKFMTCQPVVIDARATAADALRLMKVEGIRHLPVMDGTEVKGVLSERDLRTAMGFQGADTEKLKVADICTEHPYITEPDRPLGDVALEMASHHYGCAIVMQHQKVVGIFTTVDACRAVHEILHTRYH